MYILLTAFTSGASLANLVTSFEVILHSLSNQAIDCLIIAENEFSLSRRVKYSPAVAINIVYVMKIVLNYSEYQ